VSRSASPARRAGPPVVVDLRARGARIPVVGTVMEPLELGLSRKIFLLLRGTDQKAIFRKKEGGAAVLQGCVWVRAGPSLRGAPPVALW
jgi:hypothetical protein